MKKTICILMLFYGVLASAQLRDNNMNSIDVTGGYAENGYGINLAYNLYFSKSRRNNYLQLSGLFTSSTIDKQELELPYNLFTINTAYFINFPLDTRDKASANVGAGLTVGVERLNEGKTELETGALLDSEGGFVYGGFLTGEIDLFLTDNISLLIKGNWYYHLNSDIGKYTIYTGGGLRFFL